MTKLCEVLAGVLLWSFIIVKGWGTAFAAWSWWWLLLPMVPWLYRGLEAGNLL